MDRWGSSPHYRNGWHPTATITMNKIELSDRDAAIVKDVLRVNKKLTSNTRSIYWDDSEAEEIGEILRRLEKQLENE